MFDAQCDRAISDALYCVRFVILVRLIQVHTRSVIYQSKPFQGGDILLYLSPLICSSNQSFVYSFCPSIMQAVKHKTLTPISFVSVRSLRLSCRRSNTRYWPSVRLLLAHRLRRHAECGPASQTRANINPALASSSSHCTVRARALTNVGPLSTTLAQN